MVMLNVKIYYTQTIMFAFKGFFKFFKAFLKFCFYLLFENGFLGSSGFLSSKNKQ